MNPLIKSTKRKGFTLVELVVVITIIGILMAIAVPKLAAYRIMAQHSGVDQTASHVTVATMAYLASSSVSNLVNAEPLVPDCGGGYSGQVFEYFNSNQVTVNGINVTPNAGSGAGETDFQAFMSNALQGTGVSGMSFIPTLFAPAPTDGITNIIAPSAICLNFVNPYKLANGSTPDGKVNYNIFYICMIRTNNHDDLYVVTSYADAPTVGVVYVNGTR